MNKVKQIQLNIVTFTAVKNRCILHGRVFVISYYSATEGSIVTISRILIS